MSVPPDDFHRRARQFATIGQDASRLALESAESMIGVQLRLLERNASATAGFFSQLARDDGPTGLQSLLPDGLQLARDNFERLASAGHEVIDLQLKNSRALDALLRQPFSAGKDT